MDFNIVKNYIMISMSIFIIFFMFMLNKKEDEITKLRTNLIRTEQNLLATNDTTNRTVFVEKLVKDTILKSRIKTVTVIDSLRDTIVVKLYKDSIVYPFAGIWKKGSFSATVTHNLVTEKSKYKIKITQFPYDISTNLYFKDGILMNGVIIDKEPVLDIKTTIDSDTFEKLLETKKRTVLECLKVGLEVNIDNSYEVSPLIKAGYFDDYSIYGFAGENKYGLGFQASMSISQMINSFK